VGCVKLALFKKSVLARTPVTLGLLAFTRDFRAPDGWETLDFGAIMNLILTVSLFFLTAFTYADPITRVAQSGHVFTLITSYPELGESWQDESGLIWGDILKNADGSKAKLTQAEASKRCSKIGARLPTQQEAEQLWKYFGMEVIDGYYTGKFLAEILPNINDYLFNWTSNQKTFEAYPFTTGYVYSAYNSSSGTGFCYVESEYHARCVVRP
jgi:hypothetical protein